MVDVEVRVQVTGKAGLPQLSRKTNTNERKHQKTRRSQKAKQQTDTKR